jgi:hypothetical protein
MQWQNWTKALVWFYDVDISAFHSCVIVDSDDINYFRSNTTAALKPFHKTSSELVLRGGIGAGIGAWLPKGSTLKATTVVFSNEICSTFTEISS